MTNTTMRIPTRAELAETAMREMATLTTTAEQVIAVVPELEHPVRKLVNDYARLIAHTVTTARSDP